jgi:hypothetical protein
MRTAPRLIPVLILAALLFGAGCSAQQASHKTAEASNETGSMLGSVMSGVESVVLYPFHLISDIFS